MLDIRGLFAPAAVAKYLKTLPILTTPIIDTIFANRPQHPLPLIGADMLTPVVHALPMVKRSSPSIPAISESGALSFFEPFPVKPNSMVTGADLNNLKILGTSSRELWAQGRTDLLRRSVRLTTEAIAATALTGKILWPVQLETGGFDTYEVDFGTIESVAPEKLLDAAGVKIKDAFDLFTTMQEKLQQNGFGSTVELWAGKTVYGAIFAIAEATTSTAKINISITDQGVNIGGYLVKRRAERYRNPQTGAMTPVVADKDLMMIATDAGHFMPYCALDDLDGNLQPMPMLIKPIKLDDPSGFKLIGEAKPFPVPNVKGICKATAVS